MNREHVIHSFTVWSRISEGNSIQFSPQYSRVPLEQNKKRKQSTSVTRAHDNDKNCRSKTLRINIGLGLSTRCCPDVTASASFLSKNMRCTNSTHRLQLTFREKPNDFPWCLSFELHAIDPIVISDEFKRVALSPCPFLCTKF